VFNPSRNESRDFFFNLWAKSRSDEALTPLESAALAILLEHPEYHEVIGNPEKYRDRTWTPEGGEPNPFLHLALHLAIDEQVSIDQPPGIREGVRTLASRLDSEHDARHVVMECLAEMIWQAQRNGTGFDNARYLECIARHGSPAQAGAK
jgi:Domain of unknown function (DUF1841)